MAASIVRMCSSFCHVAPPRGPGGLPALAAEVGWRMPPVISTVLPCSHWPELECVASEEAGNVARFWVALCPTKPATQMAGSVTVSIVSPTEWKPGVGRFGRNRLCGAVLRTGRSLCAPVPH